MQSLLISFLVLSAVVVVVVQTDTKCKQCKINKRLKTLLRGKQVRQMDGQKQSNNIEAGDVFQNIRQNSKSSQVKQYSDTTKRIVDPTYNSLLNNSTNSSIDGTVQGTNIAETAGKNVTETIEDSTTESIAATNDTSYRPSDFDSSMKNAFMAPFLPEGSVPLIRNSTEPVGNTSYDYKGINALFMSTFQPGTPSNDSSADTFNWQQYVLPFTGGITNSTFADLFDWKKYVTPFTGIFKSFFGGGGDKTDSPAAGSSTKTSRSLNSAVQRNVDGDYKSNHDSAVSLEGTDKEPVNTPDNNFQ